MFTGPSDLHLHSWCSDGTEPPAEVMAAAHGAGVRTVALTDHDTTAGWAEAGDAARTLGLTLLQGAELSAKHAGRSVHVLAYLFDPDAADLVALMADVRENRNGRAEQLVANLARDLDVTWDDVVAQRTGDATVGRPHIADALIARGIVSSREEAFASLLSPRGPYYVSHPAPTPIDVVRAVRAAGGVPIIAHPAGRGMLPVPVLEELLDAGLAGFELDHRENTPDGRARLARIVAERDLIATGSSDYHGTGKLNRPGENTTSDEMVARIIAQATGVALVSS
ncbi:MULTISPECIES: PHP domain-containing protein [unclassified Microbacterium]|uniref:PHP domain-containing protein n=1 Tax=unclassified Microbacterium TaxID=2609290 RepID=UPI000B351CB8|nr:PHP domain-containing protein [Microbacterium sp. JB110]RCS62009.1 PHP domain-containing protein [Microbacterium sp. JB110]